MRWSGWWFLVGASIVQAASPPLSIGIETGWSAPPFILEILEAAYDESPSSYFPLLQLLAAHLPPGTQYTDQHVLSTALELIESHNLLPEPSALSSVQLALALHTIAPWISAAERWYDSHVDQDGLGVAQCGSWVEWRGRGFCGVEELKRDMELGLEGGERVSKSAITSLPFDRIYPDRPSSSSSLSAAILYYDPASEASLSFLTYLMAQATAQSGAPFIVRYRPAKAAHGRRSTSLTGYGVEMALKKTDYLVVDDRSTGGTGAAQAPMHVAATSDGPVGGFFADELGPNPWAELSKPLKLAELEYLGMKTASLIMSSDDPLEALAQISQDFPKYSAAIARMVDLDLRPEIKARIPTLLRRGQESPSFFVNGKAITERDLDPLALIRILREERHRITSLVSLGLSPRQAYELIADQMIGVAQTETDPGDGLVDASDRLEEGEVIIWWNDIEKDKRYKQWPLQLQGYLRPLYPGQFHTIRHNLWNLVLVLDMASISSLENIAGSISTMVQRGLPFRFGIVPMYTPGKEDISLQMARLFAFVVRTVGRAQANGFLAEIIRNTVPSPTGNARVDLETARAAYELLAAGSDKLVIDFDKVIAFASDIEPKIEAYTRRLLATKEENPQGHLFVNGHHVPMSGQWTMAVQSVTGGQLASLQEALIQGETPSDLSTYFYDLPSTAQRRNKLIQPGQGEYKLKVFSLPDLLSNEPTGKMANEFLYSRETARGSPLTMWIVGDLDSVDSIRVIRDAIQHLLSGKSASRLGFIHIPSPDGSRKMRLGPSTILYQLYAQSALPTIDPEAVLRMFEGDFETKNEKLNEIKMDDRESDPAAEFRTFGALVGKRLGLRDTRPHLLVNGRLVGPLTESSFLAEDFASLETYELRKRVTPVFDLLKTMYSDIQAFDRATEASLIASISSVIAASYQPPEDGIFLSSSVAPRTRHFERLDDGALSFHLGDQDNAILHVAAILDPISEVAQKWSSLLQTVSKVSNVAVSVYLEPLPEMTEVKLKRFYRYSLNAQPRFDIDGAQSRALVTFEQLPTAPIFTLALDTPPAWVTSPSSSPYDLDNLVLGNIHESITVNFQLKQLLIEGHARDIDLAPPRGLQLQLTRNGLEVAGDTQVMANLGYFQFKATPGAYDLSIRPGRGRDVFKLDSVGSNGWDSLGVNVTGSTVFLDSFEGVTLLPRFARQPGMEEANVLVEPPVQKTVVDQVWGRFKGIVGLPDTQAESSSRHAEINIFTVASGLLYERFASIMILSVMKHTESSVKFWFIENFLSPSFIKFIPQMAEEYGFKYELVTYKWPHWLRAQTEKQRIIWAYKILFLDVLFPQDLDKIIFVDADQIVRTDMKELVDLDLQGHVYGYPPMGDSRTEMEGFRFWKTGYWRDALRGRPYHISALYVIDLKRFRQLATGDRLRGQYHALAADPNSLANLDQDLPNSMQDQIPIFTLDQDWLWCQTWCSDESLATAKTIDLCQNPLTKEPKLVRARQIPEWDSYDQEIARFAARSSGEGAALGGSVDELAGTGSPPAPLEAESDSEMFIADPDSEAHSGHITGEL